MIFINLINLILRQITPILTNTTNLNNTNSTDNDNQTNIEITNSTNTTNLNNTNSTDNDNQTTEIEPVDDLSTYIIIKDFLKQYNTNKLIRIQLKAGSENLANQYLTLSLVGSLTGTKKTYTVKTDANGIVNLNIKLAKDIYTVKTVFKGCEGYKSSSNVSKVIITTNTYYMYTNDLKLEHTQSKYYQAKLVNLNNVGIANKKIKFDIIINKKHKIYYATTDANGIAKIKISKFKIGTYPITITYGKLATHKKIVSTKKIFKITGRNISINKGTIAYYTVKVTDSANKYADGKNILITTVVNGKSTKYTRTTNAYGEAFLKIVQDIGKYTYKYEFVNTSTETGNSGLNTICVKGTKIIASDLRMQPNTNSTFKVVLKNHLNEVLTNKTVRFDLLNSAGDIINNLTVNTNSAGVAYFKLIELPYGTYTIKYYFDGDEFDTANNGYKKIYSSNAKKLTLIGSDSTGNVTLLSVIGNPNSKVKIAYVVGMHPQEYQIHNELYKLIQGKGNMNYAYYIYKINLKKKTGDYSKDRMTGQKLAQKFILPHVKKQKYDLLVDVHSTSGKYYKYSHFIHVPYASNTETRSVSINYANKVISKIKSIEGADSKMRYWSPDSQTSPPYLTKPTIEAGIPTIIFETLIGEPIKTTDYRATNLINAVDSLVITKA